MSTNRGVTVVTGFAGRDLATRVLARLLETERETAFACIVAPRFRDAAVRWLDSRPEQERARVELLDGDVCFMDMGLSGREYMDLAARTRIIHHCAAITYSGAPHGMEAVNVQGTHEALELALAAPRLERLVHWSSTQATWPRDGLVLEDELHAPKHDRISQSQHRAEQLLARARTKVPITVLRPAMLLGDSTSGEAPRVDGAYLLIATLLASPKDVALPLPTRADAPLQVVPVDFAVEAGLAIARSPEAASRTFHIVDPAPLTVREALSMFAELTLRPAPRSFVPGPLTRALVRLPGLDRIVHAQRALVEELARDARYDDRNARPILRGAKLSCPPLPRYAAQLVQFVERERAEGRVDLWRASSRPPPATSRPPTSSSSPET